MAFQGNSIFWVEVDKIVPNPFQPRREFDESKLQELSESVRMYGILQPLTVTRKEIQRDDGAFYTEYELIAGERRLRASKLAGLAQVPVIIREGEDSEQEKLELAIIENLQREDLNAVDRGLAFKQLAETFNLSHAQVAKKVGRSREYVSNTLRLLQLPQTILDSLKVADISEGHARTLLMLTDRPQEQDTVYREILLKKLSVREVERIARKIAQDKVRKQKWQDTDPELIAMEKQFTETLGTRVQIAKTDYGGKLTIDYFSQDDLDMLLGLLKKKEAGDGSFEARSVVADELIDEARENNEALSKLTDATPFEMVDDEEESSTPEPESATKIASSGYVAEVARPHAEASAEPASQPQQPATPAAPTPPAEPVTPQHEVSPSIPDPTPEPTPQPAATQHSQASQQHNQVSPQPDAQIRSDEINTPTTDTHEQQSELTPTPVQEPQTASTPKPPVEKTTQQNAPVTAQPVPQPQEAQLTESESAPAQNQEPAPAKSEDDDESSLYSIRNF